LSARVLVAEDDPKQAHLIRVYRARRHSVLVGTTGGGPAIETQRRRKPETCW